MVELLHKAILVVTLGEDTVTDYGIDGIAEEGKIGLGTQCLFDYHAFGVDDGPIGTDIGIAQDFTQGFDTVAEGLDGIEYFGRGHNGLNQWTSQIEGGVAGQTSY